jgi:hypothetical protein
MDPKIGFYDSGRPYPELLYSMKKVFKCGQCDSHFFLKECERCSADESLGKAFYVASWGLACLHCDYHFDHWTCPQCGYDNLVRKTWYVPRQKEGPNCFIATAVYGSRDCQEVEILRIFRDTVLLPRKWGRWLTQLYYRNSPPLADFLRRHRAIRTLLRLMILGPIVKMLRRRFDVSSANQ